MSTELGCLDALPRVHLGHAPTPIDQMANLARGLDGLTLQVKRDDCTGLAFGGNKVRQLEFYMGEAQARRADTILITGARQSNFVRLAAAAARSLGMECHIQLEERVVRDDPLYRESGNVLLDRLLGATLHAYPKGEDESGADRQLEVLATDLANKGRRPYVIHLAPGHKPLGALGYVVAARELLQQLRDAKQSVDTLVVGSGSGSTHAGLLFGLRAIGSTIGVHGVCVRRDAHAQHGRIAARCGEIAGLLGVSSPVAETDIQLDDRFLAPGYGLLNDATKDAIERAAREEALILDPVYTGKVMAAFLDHASRAASGQSLLFWHTGGTPALFSYGSDLTQGQD
ncbi:MAG: D-cysteine desulfhydrase family protein [Pseudomonadota bacterium]